MGKSHGFTSDADIEFSKKKCAIRYELRDKQGDKCYYCGCAFAPDNYSSTIDHVKPKIEGGTNDISNLVAACIRCNYHKGSLSEAEFRLILNLSTYDEHHKRLIFDSVARDLWLELPTKNIAPDTYKSVLGVIASKMGTHADQDMAKKILQEILDKCIVSKLLSREDVQKLGI